MRFRALVFALLLLPPPAAGAKDPKWFEVSSEHFLLFTDAGEAKGRKLLSDFENRVAAVSQALGKVPQRQFKIQIFLFDDEVDFQQSLPRAKPNERFDKSAYLLNGPDRTFIVAKDKPPDDIANDVGHALGHVLFNRYVLWRPFWLAEGVAEYFRKAGRSADTKKISEEDGYPAADLLTIVPSQDYNDSDPGGAFRTQSYRLLRILLDEQPELLRGYFRDLRTEAEAAPAIHIDTAAVDAALKAYVETPLALPDARAAIQSIEADPARLAIHRGDAILATGRSSDALRAYTGDSKDAQAARAIAVRFSRTPLEAVRVLERAAQEAPDNGLVQYHLGSMEAPDPKDQALQIAALEKAVQLMPLMGRAYAELARVYTLTGQAGKALPEIDRALPLEPEYADRFYAIRADVEVALGEYSGAFHDINMASALPHPDRSTVESYMLKVSDVRKRIENARRAIDERRLERIRSEVEAEVALKEPPPPPPPPPVPVPVGSIRYQIEASAPIEVVEAVYPEYPEDLRRKGSSGNITLSVQVGPDGKVKTVSVATSKFEEMNAATLDAVRKWTFKPGGRSIRIVFTYSLQ